VFTTEICATHTFENLKVVHNKYGNIGKTVPPTVRTDAKAGGTIGGIQIKGLLLRRCVGAVHWYLTQCLTGIETWVQLALRSKT
jgi:hypothetical protein